jgi:hypothetical protein
MIDPLQFLWPAVEAVKPVFARAAIVRWPAGVHGQLVAAGLLVPQDTTTRIRCPECGQSHIAKPYARQQPDGTSRFFIPCPQNLRAGVKERDLQQWAASIDALVSALATWMQLGGKPASLDSDRVWRCGRWNYQGVLRDVLFARGLRRRDAIQFRRAITGAHRPIVFVGSEIPEADFWQGRVPPLIRLREVATFVDAKIEIDVTQVIGLVRAADDDIDADEARDAKQQRKTIRRAVKEEVKSLVSDDALVAAYIKYGSYTKAAAGLVAEGVETNRWAVERAVKKEGGIKKVMRDADSESVVRSRSSRRRDTPQKKRDSSK